MKRNQTQRKREKKRENDRREKKVPLIALKEPNLWHNLYVKVDPALCECFASEC